jgi:acetate kinase
MGMRTGDLDPAVVLYLQKSYGYSVSEVDKLLNKQSGLLGLCGQSDLRSVLQQAEQGDERAQLALNVRHACVCYCVCTCACCSVLHVVGVVTLAAVPRNPCYAQQCVM